MPGVPQGGRVTSSRTGSSAGSKMAWAALKKQSGVLMANNLEEFINFLTAFYYLPKEMGKRLAIVFGVESRLYPQLMPAKGMGCRRLCFSRGPQSN